MLQQQSLIRINEILCKLKILCTVFFTLSVASFFMLSCLTEVDIEWTEDSQKYVVNCLLTPADKIQLYAFQTSPVLSDSLNYADGMEIELFKNDALVWTGSGTGKGEYPIPVYIEPGVKYRTVLKDKTGIVISAEDSIPNYVNILSATYIFPVYGVNPASLFGKVSLSFQDEPDDKNYYEIVILGQDSGIIQTFNISSFVITLDNETDPYFPGTILFTDELFNGKQLDLNIFVNSYDPPIIVLKNVSRNYYEYRKSINIHFYNQNVGRDNIYELFKGDPVELYSNVTNGLGIFAGYTQDIKECTLINK